MRGDRDSYWLSRPVRHMEPKNGTEWQGRIIGLIAIVICQLLPDFRPAGFLVGAAENFQQDRVAGGLVERQMSGRS